VPTPDCGVRTAGHNTCTIQVHQRVNFCPTIAMLAIGKKGLPSPILKRCGPLEVQLHTRDFEIQKLTIRTNISRHT
jgi:hypothetical protein